MATGFRGATGSSYMNCFVSRLTPRCLPLIAMLAWTPHEVSAQTPASPPPSGCQFSSPPRSSLSWESGLAEGQGPSTAVLLNGIVGRVISVRNGSR